MKETSIKFSAEVPRNYKDAIWLNKLNGNTLQQDAIEPGVDQISSYKTFMNVGRNALQGYKKVSAILFLMSSLI